MRLIRTKFATFMLVFSLACAAPQLLAEKNDSKSPNPGNEKRALQALNRLTFGPRPGDIQKVLAMGVDRWIDLQLHPERIDDSALNSRLEPFRTLRLSTRELAEDFPDPQEIVQVMKGKREMPSDPARRAIYEVQLAKARARKEGKEDGAAKVMSADVVAAKPEGSQESTSASGAPALIDRERMADPSPSDSAPSRFEFEELSSLGPDQRYQKILAMPEDELVAFAETLRGGKRRDFVEGMSPQERETLIALNNPSAAVDTELAEAKLLRAIYSQRQLEEVMTDFWCNHFNVFIGKGLDHLMLTSYERDVIRPHALGRFQDLLVATAKSPAMLFYLDNWLSIGPNSEQALGNHQADGRPVRPNQGKRPSGLNENYGRELLELHTLSVNGGYSQHDVTEVAKVFTGWTIDQPAQGGGFKFEPRMHEPGTKVVLGHRIKEGGEEEGLELLHRLATSKQTAHFISLKLAERFVSDAPPPALVDHMAKIFLKKKGDIREVLSVLFHSPEFWDDSTYRAKVKTPLEFVVSSIRATGAEVDDAMPLTGRLNNMGMPLYGAQPPTGYSMKAEAWVSSSALLNRMNFALALTDGRIRGVRVNWDELIGDHSSDPAQTLSFLENRLVAGGVSQQTHNSILGQIDPEKNPVSQKAPEIAEPGSTLMTAGLLLGSPEFQRR
jgi:uncharacterized protein (DUF1800 family)